jgi:2-polyprenyl-3-methyl-5-hydroxy-6-metoxy-1,4-benzoquinol methylase
MRIKYTQCPVCNYQELSPFLVCKDYTVSGENFEIVYCTNCQTGITQNIPDQASIGVYYHSDNYISHSNTKKGFINQLYHSARNFMLKKKYQLIRKATGLEVGKLLDIGCGTGYFLQTMKAHRWEVTGIEADEGARQFAQNQFDLNVLMPEQILTLSEKQYDVITLWHVLEHIHDLHGIWQNFKRLLKPNGRLIIAVPNHQSYDAKHYQAYWAAYDVPRHLWHFSPTSLELLAERYDFRISDKKIMPFDPFYIALLSEKYKNSPLGMFFGGLHGGIALIKSWLDPNVSSSIIYVLASKEK